jgi:hypothetical protein
MGSCGKGDPSRLENSHGGYIKLAYNKDFDRAIYPAYVLSYCSCGAPTTQEVVRWLLLGLVTFVILPSTMSALVDSRFVGEAMLSSCLDTRGDRVVRRCEIEQTRRYS